MMAHALEVSVDVLSLRIGFDILRHLTSVLLLQFELKCSNLVNTRKWLAEQVVVVLTRSEVST